MAKDNIFSDEQVGRSGFLDEQDHLKSFAFNQNVARVFDDMVSRSVPGYEKVQEFTVNFGMEVILPKSSVYDLGCSTGTTLIRIAHSYLRKHEKNLSEIPKFIGIDSSIDMITRCKEKLQSYELSTIIKICQENIEDTKIIDASLVISHYTLQFLKPTVRQTILQNIYLGLMPGGHLILSEKVYFSNTRLQDFVTEKYYNFKKANGYTQAEISRKREALENVLIPLTIEENLKLLKNAGFSKVEIVSADLLFVTFVASKDI